MKKILILLTIASFLFGSCSNRSHKSSGGSQADSAAVFVSILPLKYFAKQIIGDRFPVEVMVPPGASPATYEPTPRQIQKLSNAAAYFAVGHLGFENAWLNRIRQANPNMELFYTDTGITLIKGDTIQHGDHDHHEGVDPHIWTSPKQAKQIAINIFEGMVAIDPGNREYYYQNLQKLFDEIARVDHEVSMKLSLLKGKRFLIFHPSLGYLARDYGLIQESIEFEGKSPSPKHMEEIVKKARKQHIKLILIQKQFDKADAETIAREIHADVMQIDPLDEDWPKETLSIAAKLFDSLW
ncbi:metal ABC transporter solute-binding protein, Zn/Mn family [Prolixibacter sp. NT017]|uniref:metal ABC transporter solute-binding protein, Zn/Mn family n=1 Tax=Prolixibacter sp. NT017 TaxID=2652390 RepID=UPI00126B5566|nr:zinc ABC transporter substrate-binding protein [Prolixibacter sp. NT017]GET27403.1 zinc ABC transporter substrate-binding protein [Prolixibacter sp. NT017]